MPNFPPPTQQPPPVKIEKLLITPNSASATVSAEVYKSLGGNTVSINVHGSKNKGGNPSGGIGFKVTF